MSENILICTDLDRTLIPNGEQAESPEARPRLRKLIASDNIYLAYVSGRHKDLILDAINTYDLPVPDFAIGDVGSTIYEINNDNWTTWQPWHDEIAPDWREFTGKDIHSLLIDIPDLRLQESEKQNRFKLSYYASPDIKTSSLIDTIKQRLSAEDIKANLIWSIDETTNTGLLDILPASANKLHAIRFLIHQKDFIQENCLFAGDSGNDIEVLCSDIESVLVKNATEQIKQQALQIANAQQTTDQLYLAQGNFLGMNGNYAAGILEGLIHFHPELRNLIES